MKTHKKARDRNIPPIELERMLRGDDDSPRPFPIAAFILAIIGIAAVAYLLLGACGIVPNPITGRNELVCVFARF